MEKFAPDYIEINGHVYERLNSDTVSMDLELEEDVISELESFMHSNNFVSTGEALRYVLREAMKNNVFADLLENEKENS